MADKEKLEPIVAILEVNKWAKGRLEDLKGRRDQSVTIRTEDVIDPAKAFYEGVIYGLGMVAERTNRSE